MIMIMSWILKTNQIYVNFPVKRVQQQVNLLLKEEDVYQTL